MKTIVTMLQPFTLKQTIIVYENGNKLDANEVKLNEVADTICKLYKQYSIEEITLGGARLFTQKIGKDVKHIATSKYDINDIIIKYV